MSSYRLCSKCNTVYNHQIKFCFVDGEELHLSQTLHVPQDVPRPTEKNMYHVEQTDVLPRHYKQPHEHEKNAEEFEEEFGNETPFVGDEATDWKLERNDEDLLQDTGISSLMEDGDTTITDGNIHLQARTMSQDISLHLPPLHKNLVEKAEIHFDDTTDIFSHSNRNPSLDILDSTEPLASNHLSLIFPFSATLVVTLVATN